MFREVKYLEGMPSFFSSGPSQHLKLPTITRIPAIENSDRCGHRRTWSWQQIDNVACFLSHAFLSLHPTLRLDSFSASGRGFVCAVRVPTCLSNSLSQVLSSLNVILKPAGDRACTCTAIIAQVQLREVGAPPGTRRAEELRTVGERRHPPWTQRFASAMSFIGKASP